MQWLLIGFVACTGVLNTIQAGSNTTLNKVLGAPFWAASVVFTVALTATVTAGFVSGQRLSGDTLGQVPWWGWIGGLFGALYIIAMMMTANKVGAAVFMAVTVTAAIVTSLTMDHFGLMGFEVRRAGIGRLMGAVAMICGLGLIARY
jgi:transporter family-2 protein